MCALVHDRVLDTTDPVEDDGASATFNIVHGRLDERGRNRTGDDPAEEGRSKCHDCCWSWELGVEGGALRRRSFGSICQISSIIEFEAKLQAGGAKSRAGRETRLVQHQDPPASSIAPISQRPIPLSVTDRPSILHRNINRKSQSWVAAETKFPASTSSPPQSPQEHDAPMRTLLHTPIASLTCLSQIHGMVG